MVKKRKSRGRTKGKSKGRGRLVQCSNCGAQIPIDKAKRTYKKSSFINPRLASELRRKGAYIPGSQRVGYLCISCSVHFGRYSPRAKEDRKKPYKRERR